MSRTDFFPTGDGLTLGDLASKLRCELAPGGDPERRVRSLAALDEAGPDDLAFYDNLRHASALSNTRAGAVILARRSVELVPEGVGALVTSRPAIAFAAAGQALYPSMLQPEAWGEPGVSPRASVHPDAVLEEGVTVEDFAVVAAGAEIGRGTVIAAGASIGPGCRIGRNCRIGPRAVVQYALIGNGVILHPGVSIGQDGFGYSAGPTGIAKIVQVGRVILQDGVEVGANTTIDRGSIRDTVIGENTKIDNQVQIGHNVRVGRSCIIVSQVALAGSVTLGDGVMVGGQTCVNNHLTVGDGAQIAGAAVVVDDIAPGARVGGYPARNARDWLREMVAHRVSGSGKKDRENGA